MSVYLDYNATTPVHPYVQKAILSALKNEWANPSSSYSVGLQAKEVIDTARDDVAIMIGASTQEIVFTSGGTESNNMVIHTILQDYCYHSTTKGESGNCVKSDIPHIITTNIEHDSIKLPLEVLAREGKANVSFVPVSKKTGAVDVNDIISEVRPNTRLITVMLANNETGVIQPVSEIRERVKTLHRDKNQPIYIHTDAAQAFGKINVDLEDLDVDYLTIVGHKFYGPRIGALYFRRPCPLYPIFYGGGQETGYRPGTENTCMISGLGAAARLVSENLYDFNKKMNEIRAYLEDTLKREFADKVVVNTFRGSPRLPNTLSVTFNYDITGRMLLSKATGVHASTGAACHSGGEASAVLINSGIDAIAASKTLRLSVGFETTKTDIDKAVQCLKEAILKHCCV